MTERKFTHPAAAKQGHQWQTVDGRNARIISTDRVGGSYPIVALISNGDRTTGVTKESVNTYDNEGRWSGYETMVATDTDRPTDLCDVPKEQVFYVNIYDVGLDTQWAGTPMTNLDMAIENTDWHLRERRTSLVQTHRLIIGDDTLLRETFSTYPQKSEKGKKK